MMNEAVNEKSNLLCARAANGILVAVNELVVFLFVVGLTPRARYRL